MPVVLGREAMRTRFEIVLADDRDPQILQAAGEEALDEIERVEGELSVYRHDAGLAQVNAEAAVGTARVDPVLFRFLQQAGALAARLAGAVDMTVGPLVSCYRRGRADNPAALAAAREAVGFAGNVILDPEALTVRFARPSVWLDPGALGKGYALGRAAEVLREAGVRRALLHGGTSSVLAMDPPPDAPAWSIAVEHPAVQGRRLARVALSRQAFSVSTIFGRTTQQGGRRVGHILDPRTGDPVDHTWLAAAVTEDPTEAEALSTALLVLGADGLDLVARDFPGTHALVAAPAAAGTDDLALEVLGDAFEVLAPADPEDPA